MRVIIRSMLYHDHDQDESEREREGESEELLFSFEGHSPTFSGNGKGNIVVLVGWKLMRKTSLRTSKHTHGVHTSWEG